MKKNVLIQKPVLLYQKLINAEPPLYVNINLIDGYKMPNFLGYIFIATILALPLYGACYAPIKSIIFIVNGKKPLAGIPKYQFLISFALSLTGAFCSFFFYAATKGEYNFLPPLSIYFLIQACLMLISTLKANA